MNLIQLEQRLAEQLVRDRKHPSRCSQPDSDGTVVVRPSGKACGLAYAISLITGEEDEDIMNRVGG